tara:strand:+ start:564 stop:791 length:228 start_codon:yes stop_codon:yes gene_type:complete
MKELQEIYKYAKDLLDDEPEKSAYWHYNKLINKIEEAINVIQCCEKLCDCAMPDPIDPFAEVDKDTCRKCNNLIA